MKILPFGDAPEFIETLGPVFTDETGPGTLTITMKNSAGHKYWLASVAGVTERNGAEALRDTSLYIPRDRLPDIAEDDTFYHADLLGLALQGLDGTAKGKIISVQNFGAGDLLEIQPPAGDTYYLPFIRVLTENIDLKRGIIRADTEGFDGGFDGQ